MAPEDKAKRPQIGHAGRRTSSFIREHQQSRPAKLADSHHVGIDTVVEDLQGARLSPQQNPFTGVPGRDQPPRIVEGVIHDFSHPDCCPPKGSRSNRLVATLIYKAVAKRNAAAAAGTAGNSTAAGSMPSPRLPNSASETSIPANLAPTTDIDAFPLEPPAASEPEPLDHLYGSYISPLCITSFLHLMSSFPAPTGTEEDLTSSHRCLDDPVHPLVVELTLSHAPSDEFLSLADLRKHELIYRFEREWNVDVVLQRDTPWRRHPRLVVFDMDSTLITQEVIDLLAANVSADLAAQVADITHRAMLGELEFDAAFRERVALLKGLPATFFEQLRPVLDVTQGVPQLLKALRRLGVKTAVLSGGFLPLTSWLAGELGIDHAHANEVVVDPATGQLTGEVRGVIVGKERKRELLLQIAAQEKVDISQVVAVGDGANDLAMLATAGLGVAWNAKPRVQMEASARLNGESLLDLLFLFGFTSEEVDMLTS
ncbi:phosphoserine phosphatase serb [Microdochium bolleyi]|uniref:phosphoserine phosphatase n=1 Tax=Microdochium bolleyi TaxID=196109 RepID=A0A136JAE9_9PEZI|nr:phosphoserine phosphatase serb [Microdochium bolleyi]